MKSARSRTACRNGSIRPDAAVGDSGVPPEAGIAPTAVFQVKLLSSSPSPDTSHAVEGQLALIGFYGRDRCCSKNERVLGPVPKDPCSN